MNEKYQPPSVEATDKKHEEEKETNFQEIFSMTPDKLTEEKRKEIIERALESELKPSMLHEYLCKIELEVSGEEENTLREMYSYVEWVMGEKVNPEATLYPYRGSLIEEQERIKFVAWAKAFLERVKEEVNRCDLPYKLDFDLKQDEKGIHIILKVDKKEYGK